LTAQKLNVKNIKEYWKTEHKMPILTNTISKSTYSIQNKVAPNYYTTQTGFFCNQERALEKKIKIPLRVRLGSLSYTEQLEGY
jgi:hypothetical protein